jgi:hypothetical protein
VAVSPLQQLHDDRPQVKALGGQPVLVAQGALLVRGLFEDFLGHEPLQARSEDVAGDPQVFAQGVKATDSEEHVAQHEQRPALADQLERARDRAVQVPIVVAQHPTVRITTQVASQDHYKDTRSTEEPQARRGAEQLSAGGISKSPV